MSLIGLLASMEKMIPEGHLYMRPFQFHLKEHWRYPQSLETLLPWSETISAYLEWWQNPANVMKGDLHPKDHSIQLFTDASNEGWGAHLEKASTKGLWSDREKRLLSRSNQVQSTKLSLHPLVFKQICQKWFTPHVDVFATRLNHKLPLYVSPVPDQNAWDIDALNINWWGLTAYAYPPTALLHRVIKKISQPIC